MFCSRINCPLPRGQSNQDRANSLQAARQSAEAEAESLKTEVDAVVARQQERVADWEAAVAEEESALAAKQQELQASHVPAAPATTVTVSCISCRPNTAGRQAFQTPNKCFSSTAPTRFMRQLNALHSPNRCTSPTKQMHSSTTAKLHRWKHGDHQERGSCHLDIAANSQ
jgi:cell division septation protein DedD